MEKLITFVVPCYNSADYMDKCINSLLKAGDKAEILIVNDGSNKDNTKQLADEYAAKYPDLIRAIHKENGGHGDAVCTGLKEATGRYFKVVDSDDWVDEAALKKLLETLESFTDTEYADAVLTNYVYEHVYNGKQKFVNYKKEFPVGRLFDFEESKKFATGKFISMHSVTYRTKMLKDIGLELPKHTFYVDNIFVFKPLPHVKKFYYLDVDLYRYFIGRPDQSVAESVIMKRIDQHIRVTEILIKLHDMNSISQNRPVLYRYMLSFLSIMMTINSIYLIKISTPESMARKKELWEYFKENDFETYKKCKKRFEGLAATENKLLCAFCKFGYKVVRKIFKFN